MDGPRRRLLALGAVWAVGAGVATGTGVLAVRQVADSVGEGSPPPLSAAGVETALATALATASASPTATAPPPEPPAAPSPVASPATEPAPPPAPVPAPDVPTRPGAPPSSAGAPAPQPPPARVSRSFSSRGGSIGVACSDGTPSLLYASPAQGYRVDDSREHDGRVEVRFASDDDDVRMRVVCGAAGPVEEADSD